MAAATEETLLAQIADLQAALAYQNAKVQELRAENQAIGAELERRMFAEQAAAPVPSRWAERAAAARAEARRTGHTVKVA